MTTNTITPEQRLTVLKHLAGGKGLDVVATIARLPRETVLDIASHHGYPDKSKLSWAVDVLTKKLDDDQVASIPPAQHTERVARPQTPAAATPSPVVAAGQPSPPPTQPDELPFAVLINIAKGNPSKRIQSAANRLLDDVDKLRQLLKADQEKNAKRREAQAAKAKAREEVKRLEQQLAEAKAKLRGTQPAAPKTPPGDGSATAAEVRAWARSNGVECPAVGIVPGSVRAAYDAALAAAETTDDSQENR